MSVQELSKYKMLGFEKTLQTPQSLGPAEPCPALPSAAQITPPLLCCSQIQPCLCSMDRRQKILGKKALHCASFGDPC